MMIFEPPIVSLSVSGIHMGKHKKKSEIKITHQHRQNEMKHCFDDSLLWLSYLPTFISRYQQLFLLQIRNFFYFNVTQQLDTL